MTKTLLKITPKEYLSKIKKKRIVYIVCIVVAVMLNVLFTLLRNDNNHTLFLILNVSIDVLASWFVVGYVCLTVLPMKNLYQLTLRPTEQYEIEITEMGEMVERVEKFNCTRIIAGKRVFFLSESFDVALKVGDKVKLTVASNIVTEVEFL